jgi:hypothetical protein
MPHVQVVRGSDTIIAMTDGEPNAGKYAPSGLPTNPADWHNRTKAAILNELQKLIPIRKVVIHTICIGDVNAALSELGVDPSFMRRMAGMSGGEFRHLTGR